MVMKESFGIAGGHPGNQDPVRSFAIRQAQEILKNADVIDPQPAIANPIEKQSLGTPETQVKIETPEDRLSALRFKYDGAMNRPEFLTPKFQTEFWKDMFADDKSIVVPQCDWDEEAIRRPMVDVKGEQVSSMLVYHPDKFTEHEGLIHLGGRYPSLGSYSVREGTTIRNNHETTGYVKVEAVLGAPNLNTKEGDLTKHLEGHSNYKGQRESTYILLGQALFVLTGQYPDIQTISRLPGSSRDGRMIYAYRNSDGYLRVRWDLDPQDRYPSIGGSFEEVKKA